MFCEIESNFKSVQFFFIHPVYDHLTPRLQSLLYETKKYQKTMGYKFCWVKNSYICLQKAENSQITKMKSLQDLTNLIQRDSTGNDSMLND